MRMSEVRVGMRLKSTVNRDAPDEFVTVTSLTEKGFEFSLDAGYVMIPRLGMRVLKDGHEHYGLDGEALFELVDEFCGGEEHLVVKDILSGEQAQSEIVKAVVKDIQNNGPICREICMLVDSRSR